MTTPQNRGRPSRATTAASRLASGFDSLTLDPSPQLRLARAKLQQRNFYREAWKLMARAMKEAAQSARTRS